MKRFFLITLGCAKNEVDSEGISSQLRKAGYLPTEDAEAADILIVNTCGFITPAKEESIETLLQLAEIKKNKPGTKLIMAGCFAQRNVAELKEELPEVDLFFGTDCAQKIIDAIEKKGNFVEKTHPSLYAPETGYAFIRTQASAYIKISEGCDNCCSYCAIPLIRGSFRPRKAADIIEDAKTLVSQGVLEINLISQDTSLYYDPENKAYKLENLMEDLTKIESIQWIRALYLHPNHISETLIRKMCTTPKIVPYFDIPVQHLSDPILKSMNRATSFKKIKNLVTMIRSYPGYQTIRTTLILGFPGETEEDFATLQERVKEIQFDKLGCFQYSEEEGTAAAALEKKPTEEIAEKRVGTIMQLQQEISQNRISRFIGSTIPVLIEEAVSGEDGLFLGRSPWDAPDVDGLVVIEADAPDKIKPGTIVSVKIKKTTQYDLYGVIS